MASSVTLADGTVVEASLLVAADGARSKLRERAGIATHGWDYDQSGIVVTVGHERDHQGRAEEHFLPAGPFAILPLTGKRSSLVWTENRKEAARIVALGDDEFHGELEQRFGLHLGEIKALDKPRAFPLGYFVARSFIAERLALIGDAAHVIHPIAGQGLNMGLKDVAALAEVVVDAARLGMDIGQADVLERYQRWRRFDTMAMGLATNSLNFLFSNKSTLLAHRARYRPRAGRSRAAAEKHVHPPGRRAIWRSAAAVEGRGAVISVVSANAGARSHRLKACESRRTAGRNNEGQWSWRPGSGPGRRTNSIDLARLFRQHDRDAVADRISELCRARDQFLPRRVEFQRTLGQRTDQDFQQFWIDGAFEAFGRGTHAIISGSGRDPLAHSLA